ncbi:MAG: hypothetical protein Q9218_006040 [Villophora microphyllina]
MSKSVRPIYPISNPPPTLHGVLAPHEQLAMKQNTSTKKAETLLTFIPVPRILKHNRTSITRKTFLPNIHLLLDPNIKDQNNTLPKQPPPNTLLSYNPPSNQSRNGSPITPAPLPFQHHNVLYRLLGRGG